MRRGGVVMSVMGTLLLAMTLDAVAGPDMQLGTRELRSEMTLNRKLSAYIGRNGCPDIAQARFLADEGPWDEYQVTLYYFGLRKEISFARALILGEPSIHLEKSERPLTDQDIARLEPKVRPLCTRMAVPPAPRAAAAQPDGADVAGFHN
jgi:hypothetical protein